MKKVIFLTAIVLTMAVMIPGSWAKRAPYPLAKHLPVPHSIEGNRIVNDVTGQTEFITISAPMPIVSIGDRENFVRNWLASEFSTLGLTTNPDLKLMQRQETPGGEVLRFYQTSNGYIAPENDLVAQFDSAGRLLSIHQSLNSALSIKGKQPVSSESKAIETTRSAWQVIGDNYPPVVTLNAWISPEQTSYLAYRVILTPQKPYGEFEAMIDAETGNVLRKVEKTKYVNGTGMVFDPDPLTTAQATYGQTGYIDNNDANSPQLTAQRHLRIINGMTGTSTYRLSGTWVTLLDFESPTSAIVTATNPDSFRFLRQAQGFEDVMCYIHIDSCQRYIQSLGFTNIRHDQITCDPHGLSGDDNSHFLPTSNRVAFGEGGVDDDEDVDVIWHEYGHAIQASQVTYWEGGDADALGEGFGDYWAGSYSASISSFHSDWVYNWDGHNEYWDGRVLNYTALYPAGLTGYMHDDGQIWSHAMWESEGSSWTRNCRPSRIAGSVLRRVWRYFPYDGSSGDECRCNVVFGRSCSDDPYGIFRSRHHDDDAPNMYTSRYSNDLYRSYSSQWGDRNGRHVNRYDRRQWQLFDRRTWLWLVQSLLQPYRIQPSIGYSTVFHFGHNNPQYSTAPPGLFVHNRYASLFDFQYRFGLELYPLDDDPQFRRWIGFLLAPIIQRMGYVGLSYDP